MKNVTLQGASYSDVPAIDVPQTGGGTARFIDPSDTTATASDVASGKYFHGADGVLTLGTASGGGGSSWTKVCEKSYQVTTTSTSAATVEEWATGHSEIWTSSKILYIRVRDTAGKRNGYFYGSDNFFSNVHPANGASTSSIGNGLRYIYRCNDNGTYGVSPQYNTNGMGVFVTSVQSNGVIVVKQAYNSFASKTINGTYKVEVYLIDPPFTIFE